MGQKAMDHLIDALKSGKGLRDEFIDYMTFEDYRTLSDPLPRTPFDVEEVEESIYRYPDPRKPGELFRWDIHGRLFTPRKISLENTAVVMIHGGAANEYEFIFTPDGSEAYLDLTRIDPSAARVGVAQHIASLGIPVLALSLPAGRGRRSRSGGPNSSSARSRMTTSLKIAWPSIPSECASRRSRRSSKRI